MYHDETKIVKQIFPSFRWRNCELMPLTGLRTSRICQWTFASQEKLTTLSNVAGESAAMVIAATATAHQPMGLRLTGPPTSKENSVKAKQSPDRTPPLILLLTLSLDQRRTLKPLRPTEFLRKKLRRRKSLLRMSICHNLWTTLGRTLPSLMSLQTLRVLNYMWILSSIRKNPALATGRGDATDDLFVGGALKLNPTLTDSSPMEMQDLFKIFH